MKINSFAPIRIGLSIVIVLAISFLFFKIGTHEKGLGLNFSSNTLSDQKLPRELNIASLPQKLLPFTDPFWSYSEQEIQVRGFWYLLESDSRGCGILTSRPNLKSCCLGSSLKIAEQIIVKGKRIDLADGLAISLKGVFRIDPSYNENGDLIQLYVLDRIEE